MSYRDDHEAALARVDALEREVADLRADDATQADRIAYLEESLAEARRARDRAQAALDKLQPRPAKAPAPTGKPPDPPAHAPDPAPSSSPAVPLAIGGVLCGAAIVIISVIAASRDRHDSAYATAAPPKPQPALPASADPTSRLIDEAIHARLATSLPGGFLEKIEITAIDETGAVHPEYQGGLRVQFERLDPTPPPAPRPVGAPPAPKPENDGYACLVMSHDAGTGWVDMNIAMMCNMMSMYPRHDAVAEPKCTPTAIWRLARGDGATAGAIAAMTYDGSWQFTIRDEVAPFEHRYDDNCTPAR